MQHRLLTSVLLSARNPREPAELPRYADTQTMATQARCYSLSPQPTAIYKYIYAYKTQLRGIHVRAA
jgi:hypothetical protein